MPVATKQKFTINTLSEDRFRLLFYKVPSSQYMSDYSVKSQQENIKLIALSLRTCLLPDVKIDEVKSPTPFGLVSDYAQTVNFGPFEVEFQVGEDFYLYNLLFTWMLMERHPEMFGGITKDIEKNFLFVPGVLILLDNHNQKIGEYKFVDLHPTSLSRLSLTYTIAEYKPIYATVSFGYTYFLPSDDFEPDLT